MRWTRWVLSIRALDANSALQADHPVDVAAGLVFDHGRLLITQRRRQDHLGGLWEFPGGKRELGETFEQCLARELNEELGIEVQVGKPVASVVHAYPTIKVFLQFFLCRWIRGVLRPIGCACFEWITLEQLDQYPFPPADAQILHLLKENTSWWRCFEAHGK